MTPNELTFTTGSTPTPSLPRNRKERARLELAAQRRRQKRLSLNFRSLPLTSSASRQALPLYKPDVMGSEAFQDEPSAGAMVGPQQIFSSQCPLNTDHSLSARSPADWSCAQYCGSADR